PASHKRHNRFALHFDAGKRAVPALRFESVDINAIFYFRIDKGQIGSHAFPQCAEGDCKDSGRVARYLCDCLQGSQDAFAYEPQNERQGRFQTNDAICCIFEFQLLFNCAVRRMIRSNNIDCPVAQPGLYRLDVLGPPQRWIDLVDRVEGGDQFFGKCKIMGCGLCADWYAPFFGLTYQRHRPGGADMSQMKPAPGKLCQKNVAGHHNLFSSPRYAPHAEPCRYGTLIHQTSAGKVQVFTVAYDKQVESFSILERAPHKQAVHDGAAVVRYRYDACGAKFPVFRNDFTLEPLAYGPHGEYSARALIPGLVENILGYGGAVVYRVRVGHARHRGESSRNGSLRSRADCFLVFFSRFPQMNMH